MSLNTELPKNRFKFNLPLEITKSDEKGWKVRGLASTEDTDLQGEIVRQAGLDISVLKAGRGLLNYEHKNDPENLIGLIENADISKKGLEIEGYLFKKHKRAQAIAEIMQSLDKGNQSRVQLSIEGKIRERNPENNKEIKQAMIDRVAITFEPVNQSTYLSFAKSLLANEDIQEKTEEIEKSAGSDPKEIVVSEQLNAEIEKSLSNSENVLPAISTETQEDTVEKTLTAGYGTADAPATRTQGGALGMETTAQVHSSKNTDEEDEDEEEDEEKVKPKLPVKSKKAMLKRALERAFKEFPEVDFKILTKTVISSFFKKFSENGE